MIEEINDWLDHGRDYRTGLSLYDQYGTSASLKRILSVGGENTRNKDTLLYELRKLIRDKKKIPVIIPHEILKPEKVVAQVNDRIETDQGKVLALELERKNLYKVLDNSHATLGFVEKDKRKDQALEILKADEQLNKINARLDYFKLHGVLPPETVTETVKGADSLSPGELIHRQVVVRTYVSKYKRLAETGKSLKDIAKNRDLQARYQLELDDINERLKK